MQPYSAKVGDMGSSTGSEHSWQQINTWLEDCDENHPGCRSPSVSLWKPNRLLDLGNDEHQSIRLVVSEKHFESNASLSQVSPSRQNTESRYMTISHCWGTSDILRLLSSNAVFFQQSILLDALPETFKDAISITRRLGIRYLWIDSLCIIQDSIEDWRKEASAMGDVYKNSFLNIAATGSKESSEGYFHKRSYDFIEPIEVSPTWKKSTKGPYLWLHNIGLVRYVLNMSPLLQRGWVLQERLLSPRVLHFGKDELFWECQGCVVNESYPEKIPIEIGPNLPAGLYDKSSWARSLEHLQTNYIPQT
jgi:hypothetical protein